MLVSKRMMHKLESAVWYRSTANNLLVLHCSSNFFVPCVVFQPVSLSCVVFQPVLLCHVALCFVMLCWASTVSCHTELRCAALRCAVLCCDVLCCAALGWNVSCADTVLSIIARHERGVQHAAKDAGQVQGVIPIWGQAPIWAQQSFSV